MGHDEKKSIPHRLVEAAFACITEEGFAAASVSQIARLAGVDRSTFYHYFEGKDDLVLNGCIRHIVGSYPAQTGAVVVDRFETDIWFLYQHVGENAHFYRSIDADPFGKRFWRELVAEIELRCFPIEAISLPTHHDAEPKTEGSFSTCAYHVSVMSVIFGFLQWWLPQIERYESHKVYAGAISAVRGIRAVHATLPQPSRPTTTANTRGWESHTPLVQPQSHGKTR